MDEDSSHNLISGRASALRLGSHSYPSTLLLVAAALTGAFTILPPMFFVFGSGWFAPLLLALSFFLVAMLFKKILFKNLYKHPAGDGDTALLEYLVQQNAANNGTEEEIAVELLENAMHLKQVRAHDCMAPRPEIVHIDIDQPVEVLRQIFVESSLSRIIVTEQELDRVIGYVHVQQLFSHPTDIRSIVLPISFVPETIPVNDLLHKFIKSSSSIACVVDEYGSLAGLITLEDALEQLFGEIDDEHDQEEFIEARVSDTEYLFSGRLKTDYLNAKYPGLDIPEGEYHTLSGYLVTTTQTIPEQGARIILHGKTFILELVSDRKIETVRIILPA